MRRAAILVLGLLALTAVALTLALRSVDSERIRERLTGELSRATGYEIQVQGPLALHFFPQPGLRARGIRIASSLSDRAHPLVKAEELNIRLALLASLRHGAVRLAAIELNQVEARLVRDANGRDNWLPPASGAPPPPAPENSAPSSLGSRVDPTPRQLEIDDLELHFVDEGSGQSTLLALTRVRLSRKEKGAPVHYDLQGSVDSEVFQLSGTVTPQVAGKSGEARLWGIETKLSMKETGTLLSAQGVTGALPDLTALNLTVSLASQKPLELADRLGVSGVGPWSGVVGSLELTGHLLGTGPKALRVEKAVLTGGREKLLDLKVSGSIEDVLEGSGFEFDVALDSPDIAQALSPLELGVSEAGPTQLRAKLRGSAASPLADEIQLHLAPKEGLDLKVHGKLGYASGALHGALDIDVDGRDLETLFEYLLDLRPAQDKALRADLDELRARPLGQHLLALAPLRLSGQLTTAGGRWGLAEAKAKIGPAGKDWVEVSGQAHELWPTLQQLTLRTQAHLVTPHSKRGGGKKPIDAIERIDAEGLLVVSDGKPPSLSDLNLSLSMESQVDVEARGELILGGGAAGQSGNLAISMKSPDLAALGRIWGGSLPAWGPLSLRGELNGTLESLDLKGLKIHFGSETLEGAGSYVAGQAIPNFDLELRTEEFNLARLGLALSAGGEERKAASKVGAETAPGAGDPAPPSFRIEPSELAWLSKTKARVAVRANQVILAENWVAEDLKAEIAWAGGLFRGPDLQMHWPEGKLSLRGEVDARQPVPALSLGFAGNGFPLGSFVAWAGHPGLGTGPVTASLNLSSRGSDLAELSSHLGGGFLVEVGQGKVAARYADEVALSLHLKPQAGDVPMNCLVAAVRIEQGIIRSDALLWDTPRKQVLGMGVVNLPQRSVDILLRPHLKETVTAAITAAVRVKGPFDDPSLRPEPIQTATDLTRGLLDRAVRVVGKVSPQFSKAVEELGSTTGEALSATGVNVPLVSHLLEKPVTCESVEKQPEVIALKAYDPASHFSGSAPGSGRTH